MGKELGYDFDSNNRFDANETATFERALAYVKSRTYDRLYPKLTAFSGALPISYEAGPLADSIKVQSFDSIGVAKIISDYADDLPRVDVKGEEATIYVRSVGDAYGFSWQEGKQAAAGMPLNTRKANQAKDAIFRELNRIAMKARPAIDAKLCGLIYQPNITVGLAPNNAGGTSRLWSNKTPDEILADLNGIVIAINDATNGVEAPDTIGIPVAQYGKIATTPRSSTSDTTILQYFLANNPWIKSVRAMPELKGVTPRPSGTGGTADLLIAYENSSDKLTFEIPQPFEQLPAEARSLEILVNCHARTAGVAVYYPLSIAIWEGI